MLTIAQEWIIQMLIQIKLPLTQVQLMLKILVQIHPV